MARRTLLILGILLVLLILITGAMLYPYVPGQHDPMAFGISTIAQLIGIVGLPVALVALPWLVYEFYKRRKSRAGATVVPRRFGFALATLLAGAFLLAILAIGAWSLAQARALGLLLFLGWAFTLYLAIPWLRSQRKAETPGLSPVPVYLVLIPLATLCIQLAVGESANTASRNRVIAASAQLIEEIEAWHSQYDLYPETLVSLNKDYQTNVVGIDRYLYAPNGDGYDLIVENPRFVLHDFGAREMVVYNPFDEHRVLSHAAWHLAWPPEVAATRQGWFVDFDAGAPHWKYFLFD